VHTMTRQQQQQQQRQDVGINNNHHHHHTGGNHNMNMNNMNRRQEVGNGGNSGSSSSSSQHQLEMDRAALTQKNHRLAKELSDLRVKHREENKVVSRLTMENMNLASRCRQVISEAVDLKRKVAGYEKRHGDFGNLQKEVLLLRRQIERQHGGNGGGGVEKVEKSFSSSSNSSSGRRNRSTSPKGVKRGNNGSEGASTNTPVDEKKKKKASAAVATASASATNGSLTLETKNSTETTDLDRIMAQELFKKNSAAAASVASTAGSGGGGGGGGGGVSDGNASTGTTAEKKDGNANAMAKKFQELNISTNAAATTTTTSSSSSTTTAANTKSGGGSKVASSSTLANNATSSASKRSNTTTATSSGTDSTSNSSSNNNNISSANTKIPISVTTSSAAQKDDDEFDAEIDMVDFFAKSSQTKLVTSSSTSSAAHNNSSSSSSNSSGADGVLPSSKHVRSHISHKLKKTETDDHMPEELAGTADLLSPQASSSDENVGDNLLSSLDAFEASFASAFPETSFSIKSEAPSTTQLDMSFDVPVFDPFFKSPANKDRDGSSTSSSLQSPPKSKSSTSGVAGSGNKMSPHKDGMKSQMKDLFPDSALTTSPKRGLDLTFDSTFPDVDVGGGSSSSNSNTNKSGKGKSSLSADKLDSAFSRAHATTTTTTAKSTGGSSVGSGGGGKSSSSARPAPLDMSAEIEQLDALASATEKVADGGGDGRKRSVRKVKTPISYAEPSISQKLRRGDVLFPKVDADRKVELEAKQRSKSGGAGSGGISPTTDLDRIMREHFSVSNNSKKDGTAPS